MTDLIFYAHLAAAWMWLSDFIGEAGTKLQVTVSIEQFWMLP